VWSCFLSRSARISSTLISVSKRPVRERSVSPRRSSSIIGLVRWIFFPWLGFPIRGVKVSSTFALPTGKSCGKSRKSGGLPGFQLFVQWSLIQYNSKRSCEQFSLTILAGPAYTLQFYLAKSNGGFLSTAHPAGFNKCN